jgi:cellulose synthase/poly-beta-1,6-N-acetylglucosamine synthase-like glycosyltransferase
LNTLGHIIKSLEVFFGCYSILYIFIYCVLGILSFVEIKKYYSTANFLHKDVIIKSNNAIGVSIIAPAYNEGLTIVSNAKSLLSQEYPKYEVIIINDGSTDDTLEKLINEFSLVKVDFFYQEKVKSAHVRGHYRSTNPIYNKLLIVDKENGKSKADAANAGINSAKYSLFVCTDVDCILRRDTIAMLVKPFIESTRKVIATGAAIRISNSCEFKEGMLFRSHYPKNFFARFQELEYIRSFLYGRMAWSRLNGLLLVSGGLGMFDKKTVIEVGGYKKESLGEDMELITRMRQYMHLKKEKFAIKYIPESLCWTEGPSDAKIFLRQRVRWARGLIQNLFIHRNMIGNPKYGITGLVVLPYYILCEFIVPILEVVGLIFILLDVFYFGLDYYFLFIISVAVYLFYTLVTLLSVYLDQSIKQYTNIKDIMTLIAMVFLEPFLYHPINIYASIKGYFHFIINKEKSWGVMTRQGFNQSTQ